MHISDKTQILCDLEEKTYDPKRNRTLQTNKTKQTVTVIIPFKDKWFLTKKCLEGLVKQKQEHTSLSILLVDNNSCELETKKGLEEFKEFHKEISIRTLLCQTAFNFSYINNFAVKSLEKKSDFLWFLNNDTSFISDQTLENYTIFASQQESLGALGSTLLFGDEKTIQHSFLAPGVKIVGAHPLKGQLYKKDALWFQKPRLVPAVTGASLFISYENFCSVGMFDEKLAFSSQDLDLCLRLAEKGLQNWTLTNEIIIHHESMTRNHSFKEDEIYYFYKKWGKKLETFSRLSTWNEEPCLKFLPLKYPWALAMRIQNYLSSFSIKTT